MIRFEGRGALLPACAASLVLALSADAFAQTAPTAPKAPTPAPLPPTPTTAAPAAAAPVPPAASSANAAPGSASAPATIGAATAEAPPRPVVAGGRRMALDECITIALSHNVDSLTSDVEVTGARSERNEVRGEFLTKLRLEGAAQLWNSEFSLPFAIPGSTGPTPVITARDNFTWTGSVSLIQPLTTLWQIYDQYKVRDLGVDVAQVRRDVTRRDLAFKVAEAYMRLLEAQKLADVAGVSVTQLEAQKRQAQSLYDNGVIGKNDYLRADLALADAKERVLRTEGNVVLARSQLGMLMGSADTAVDPIVTDAEPPPSPEASLGAAESRALGKRIELREVDLRIEQADKRVSAAHSKLIPQANLVGNYTHFSGSAFQQKDAAYVGVAASWDAWDWGTTYSGISTAKARREQAILARTKLEDELRLEARQAFINAQTAKEALVVARAALTQAEENYRIVSKRFAASTATSFDNVDAESLLTQTRARVESALYGYQVARLALQRAIGEMTPNIH
jgi:outer membrane protein TolC